MPTGGSTTIDVMYAWLDEDGKLQGDRDPDGDSLGIKSITQPQHGSAGITGGGRSYSPYHWWGMGGCWRQAVTYTAAAGYSGEDSFNYTIEDGKGGEATAKVTIKVVADGVVALAIAGDSRFRINDDFTEHLVDPNRPNYELSDRNPDPGRVNPASSRPIAS